PVFPEKLELHVPVTNAPKDKAPDRSRSPDARYVAGHLQTHNQSNRHLKLPHACPDVFLSWHETLYSRSGYLPHGCHHCHRQKLPDESGWHQPPESVLNRLVFVLTGL